MLRTTTVVAFVALAALPPSSHAQQQEGSVVLVDEERFRLRLGADVGLQFIVQDNAFWGLGRTFAPGSGYDEDPTWGELYLKPYLTFSADVGGVDAFGKLSLVATKNIGTDIFDVENASAVALEDAFIGIRAGALELSVGSQPYQLGTGMLIADGGGDGFEKGNIIFGPRRAWEMTALGRVTLGQAQLEAFYLDPRELESSDTRTTLAGASLTYRVPEVWSLGIAAGTVPESEALWVQAGPGGFGAPRFIANGRDGLGFVTAWGSWSLNEAFSIAADVAVQSNESQDMNAWAGRVQLAYAVQDNPYKPRFGYTFQTFSGDDPGTGSLERFDPLFYDGSPASWGSGSNASLVFLNTNINAHQVWAALTLTPQDYFTARYYHVRANELLSPLQYGQGTRLTVSATQTVIAGVTDRHLSDDLYLEYTRVLQANAFLTAGLGISEPGAGMREIGATQTWTGGYVNLVLKF